MKIEKETKTTGKISAQEYFENSKGFWKKVIATKSSSTGKDPKKDLKGSLKEGKGEENKKEMKRTLT